MPRNQFESVVYFMAHLDLEMVNTFLADDKTYQDFPKYLFLSKLSKAFEEFEKAGDKVLSIHKGRCNACYKGRGGYTFLGKDGHYMDLVFELNDGKQEIVDMFECACLINDEPVPNKIARVDIDKMIGEWAPGDEPPF